MSNEKLREALQRIQYKAVSLADAQVIALEALATTEPVDEREAFTNDTKAALMAGRAYAQEALIRFDDAYDRHPSTEPERNAILADIQLIDAAMAQGVKG